MMMRLLIKLVLVAGIAYSSLAAAETAPSVPATVSYTLPTDGPLPRTYRVTLAITAPDNPDWIVSTFVAGEPRTVTEENQGRFTETWDGLDDNFMPVPPGEYGVKGIYMPSEVWAPDGKPHTLRAKYLSGPNALMPRRALGEQGPYIRGESGPFITGDQVEPGMGDVAVGPNGIAVFYWKFLENAQNAYRVDLNHPLGPEQLLGGFNSGGMGGGPRVATDGETVWAVAPDAEGVSAVPYVKPYLCRADERPFGTDHSRYRRNVTIPEGHVTGLAAWRPPAGQSSVLYVAERGRIVETSVKSQHIASVFRESAEERVNIVRALDGTTAKELSRVPISEPTAIALADGADRPGRGRWRPLLRRRPGTQPDPALRYRRQAGTQVRSAGTAARGRLRSKHFHGTDPGRLLAQQRGARAAPHRRGRRSQPRDRMDHRRQAAA
jgi:hypothetical protein